MKSNHENPFQTELNLLGQAHIPKFVLKIIRSLRDEGFEAYLVGGCIRDILTGLKPKDFDIATAATPEEVRKTFKASRIIGKRFKLVHVYQKNTIIEVATFRKDVSENNFDPDLVKDDAGKIELHRPRDRKKDQTYFLHGIPYYQLKRLIFPLQDHIKSEVRLIAEKLELDSASKPDSQEICFVDKDYRKFLEAQNRITQNPGNFVNLDGQVLGKHRGVPFYTIGQRRGLGISDRTPWYVVAINVDENEVVLGKRENLLINEVQVKDINWLIEPPQEPREIMVQLRYSHRGCEAILKPVTTDQAMLHLPFSERAVTAGQAAVFYEGDRVLGGGWIESCSNEEISLDIPA